MAPLRFRHHNNRIGALTIVAGGPKRYGLEAPAQLSSGFAYGVGKLAIEYDSTVPDNPGQSLARSDAMTAGE